MEGEEEGGAKELGLRFLAVPNCLPTVGPSPFKCVPEGERTPRPRGGSSLHNMGYSFVYVIHLSLFIYFRIIIIMTNMTNFCLTPVPPSEDVSAAFAKLQGLSRCEMMGKIPGEAVGLPIYVCL